MNIDRHKMYAIAGHTLDRIQETARTLTEDWNLPAAASFDQRRACAEILLYLVDQAQPLPDDEEDGK